MDVTDSLMLHGMTSPAAAAAAVTARTAGRSATARHGQARPSPAPGIDSAAPCPGLREAVEAATTNQ